jgi:beta-N-acetylhexosaminidase
MNRHLIIGLEGLVLSERERTWLRDHPPLGVILFARNIESPAQVAALLSEVRACTGLPTWAAIDEEGGRVHRLPWAPFDRRHHAAEYGEQYEHDPEAACRAVFDDSVEAGLALSRMGFTHNCAPVLDVFRAEGHDIIGSRAYSDQPAVVAALGTACMQGLQEAGIEAVGKHFPGHGRADADSHLAVPQVGADLSTLLAEAEPFRQLGAHGLAHIMTAHVIYTAVDGQVATLSRFWLHEVLRQRFGFTGRIWSDDLCMKGVGDDVPAAADAALAAGCDVLLVCQPEGVEVVYRRFANC